MKFIKKKFITKNYYEKKIFILYNFYIIDLFK